MPEQPTVRAIFTQPRTHYIAQDTHLLPFFRGEPHPHLGKLANRHSQFKHIFVEPWKTYQVLYCLRSNCLHIITGDVASVCTLWYSGTYTIELLLLLELLIIMAIAHDGFVQYKTVAQHLGNIVQLVVRFHAQLGPQGVGRWYLHVLSVHYTFHFSITLW